MLELVFLLTITQMGEPYIECPSSCYSHTDKDLWAVWYQVENFDPAQKQISFYYDTIQYSLPVYTTATKPVDFKFVFRWLQESLNIPPEKAIGILENLMIK